MIIKKRYGLFLWIAIYCDKAAEPLEGSSLHLKLVPTIFYQIFIFSPNDSLSKTKLLFIGKALFVIEIFKFLLLFTFPSTIYRFERTNGSGIIYVMNWLE